MKELLVKKMTPTAQLPTRATEGSAGYDLYADLPAPVTIAPGEIAPIPTGIAIALQDNHTVGLVYGRSGLAAKHGITLANSVGVIDADYRGEVHAVLINRSAVPFTVQPGDRIAQLIITPIYLPTLTETEELPQSHRGSDGFGSSGR